MLTYSTEQPPLLISNPTQPIYTIAYRPNNGTNLMASSILTGPAATTYVTAARDQVSELNNTTNASDDEENNCRTISRQHNLKKVNYVTYINVLF